MPSRLDHRVKPKRMTDQDAGQEAMTLFTSRTFGRKAGVTRDRHYQPYFLRGSPDNPVLLAPEEDVRSAKHPAGRNDPTQHCTGGTTPRESSKENNSLKNAPLPNLKSSAEAMTNPIGTSRLMQIRGKPSDRSPALCQLAQAIRRHALDQLYWKTLGAPSNRSPGRGHWPAVWDS